jgi:hypothetical protein
MYLRCIERMFQTARLRLMEQFRSKWKKVILTWRENKKLSLYSPHYLYINNMVSDFLLVQTQGTLPAEDIKFFVLVYLCETDSHQKGQC